MCFFGKFSDNVGLEPTPLAYSKKWPHGVAASKIAGQLNLDSDFD